MLSVLGWNRFSLRLRTLLLGLLLGISGCTSAPATTSVPSPASAVPAASSSPSAAATAPPSAPAPVVSMDALLKQIVSGPHTTVKAADGAVELLIPPTALPAGTKASDIRVQPVAAGSINVNGTSVTAYEFTPDGLQFTQPVIVRATLTAPADGATLWPVSVANGEVERLGPASIAVDAGKKTVSVVAPLRHFSKVIYVPQATDIIFACCGQRIVGETFPVRLRFEFTPLPLYVTELLANAEARQLEVRPPTGRISGKWDTSGSQDFRADLTNVLRPTLVENAPPPSVFTNSFTLEQSFSCVDRGKMSVGHFFTILYDFGEAGVDTWSSWSHRDGECVDAVSPIQASFSQGTFSTRYTANLLNPNSAALNYRWDGPDCGTQADTTGATSERSTSVTMNWAHPHPPCAATTDHSDVKVTLTVDFPLTVATCTYQGSISGIGEKCTYKPR